jgi:hypothetical protein
MLRLLATALVCAALLKAVDPEEDHIRKSIPVSSATRLVLNADAGGIHVQPSASKNVEVDVIFRGNGSRTEFDRMLHDFTLDVGQQGGDVRVTGAFHRGWVSIWSFWPMFFGGGHQICHDGRCLEYSSWLREIEYQVTVPDKFAADLETDGGPIDVRDLDGELNARTSGGGIKLEGGKGSASVHTSGGPIWVKQSGGDVEASTSGGPITIEGNVGRVRARTSGGPIVIRDAAGAVDASTSGGPVTASLIGQPKEECRLTTSGGGITVMLAKNIHMDLDASTSGGGVWTDFPLGLSQGRHLSQLRGPLNGGGPLLYLHTSGGGIVVRRADGGRDLGPVY